MSACKILDMRIMEFKLTRRRFLIGSLAAAVGIAVDMSIIEPRWLSLARVDVALPGGRLARPITILHISDLHASLHVPIAFIRRAIELGIAQEPDLACITGDMISGRIPDRQDYVDSLSLLSAACPCFACVGNHDGGRWAGRRGGHKDLREIRRLMDDSGITLLFNRSELVTIGETAVELVGLGDLWARDAHPELALMGETPQATRIVLSHNPDSKELVKDYAWDLMLCGHTHGGQISLPFLGAPLVPVRDRRYVYGLNQWQDRLIYTTSGVGNAKGLRLNCRPEIAILTLS